MQLLIELGNFDPGSMLINSAGFSRTRLQISWWLECADNAQWFDWNCLICPLKPNQVTDMYSCGANSRILCQVWKPESVSLPKGTDR